jgi:hypothetical protein
MLLDQSQSEKKKIIDWLVSGFVSRPSSSEQLKYRNEALQSIQKYAHGEDCRYEAYLLTIVRTLVAPNEDEQKDHDWLRERLTSLADQSTSKSESALKKAEYRNEILAMVDEIPSLLREGEGVKVLRWNWI